VYSIARRLPAPAGPRNCVRLAAARGNPRPCAAVIRRLFSPFSHPSLCHIVFTTKPPNLLSRTNLFLLLLRTLLYCYHYIIILLRLVFIIFIFYSPRIALTENRHRRNARRNARHSIYRIVKSNAHIIYACIMHTYIIIIIFA